MAESLPMSTGEALALTSQLARLFRGAARSAELVEHLAGLEQTTAEQQRLADAARAAAHDARRDLAHINATAEQARAAARAATAAKDAAIAEEARKTAQAKADADARIAEAKAEAERVVAQERAATERQVADLAAQIAAKRAELDGVEASLAALRAKLGA